MDVTKTSLSAKKSPVKGLPSKVNASTSPKHQPSEPLQIVAVNKTRQNE